MALLGSYTVSAALAGYDSVSATVVVESGSVVTADLAMTPAAGPTFSLDVDGNAAADALTDGLLVLRRILGIGGEALIAGAVASDCDDCTATKIEAAIDDAIAADLLDADDDDDTDLTDARLILRYLFGFRGASLVEGVCPSCNAATIAATLQTMMP